MDNNFIDVYPDKINYEVLVDVVQTCGKAHNPRSFAIDVGHQIGRIVSFDQFWVFFIDANGKVNGQYLRGIDNKWKEMYNDYYMDIQNGKFSLYRPDVRENPNCPYISAINWAKEGDTDFTLNYIRPRGLKHSCGFMFYDLYGNYRMVFSLDRTRDIPFTNRELYNLQQAVIMLNDLHKNFHYQGNSLAKIKQKIWADAKLTAREIEVVDLMAQGVSPAQIARILYISLSTTYKHIAHIYEKMHVSSQQELLVKLLRGAEDDTLPIDITNAK